MSPVRGCRLAGFGSRAAVFALIAGLGTAALVQSAAATTGPSADPAGAVVSAVPAAASSWASDLSGVQPVVAKPAAARVAPAARRTATTVAAPARAVGRLQPARQTTAASSPATGVPRDAYPWARATTNAYDDYGFTRRQCVSYVAWRLALSGRRLSNDGNVWGSALQWDETARAKGVPVSTRPVVGAVAHWNPGETSLVYAPGSSRPSGRFSAGVYGHVAYVTAVYPDGTVQVSQYNLAGDRKFSSLRMTAPRFLLFA